VAAGHRPLKTRRLWLTSLAGGAGLTLLAALATAYLAIIERGPGWLRSFCVAIGIAATPFWLAAGVLGARAGGPRPWTIAAALVFNVVLWGALFYALMSFVRSWKS
jgi:hypothetical protein